MNVVPTGTYGYAFTGFHFDLTAIQHNGFSTRQRREINLSLRQRLIFGFERLKAFSVGTSTTSLRLNRRVGSIAIALIHPRFPPKPAWSKRRHLRPDCRGTLRVVCAIDRRTLQQACLNHGFQIVDIANDVNTADIGRKLSSDAQFNVEIFPF